MLALTARTNDVLLVVDRKSRNLIGFIATTQREKTSRICIQLPQSFQIVRQKNTTFAGIETDKLQAKVGEKIVQLPRKTDGA